MFALADTLLFRRLKQNQNEMNQLISDAAVRGVLLTPSESLIRWLVTYKNNEQKKE